MERLMPTDSVNIAAITQENQCYRALTDYFQVNFTSPYSEITNRRFQRYSGSRGSCAAA
jgi:hypothetical protein